MITISTDFTALNTIIDFQDDLTISAGATSLAGSLIIVAGNWTTGNNTFAAGSLSGSNIVVTGDLLFGGTPGNVYDFTDSHWALTVGGTALAHSVKVSNSDASEGSPIFANDGTSIDESGNLNWFFVLPSGLCGELSMLSRFEGALNTSPALDGTLSMLPRFAGTLQVGKGC